MRRPSRPFQATTSLVAAVAVSLVAATCKTTTQPSCIVQSVVVTPSPVTLTIAQTATLTATVTATNCSTAPAVTWASGNAAVGVVPNGTTAQISGVSATASPVAVTASAGGQSGSAQVSVVLPPSISLSGATLSFSAPQGGANPASQFITITNGGGGSLTGLSTGTIVYGAGATGWLQAPNLNGTTAPATLTIQPVTGSLAPGSYSATIPVQSGVAANSPQTLTVDFTITPSPLIGLSATSLTYSAIQGGADPASQFITITNSGSGSLTGLSTGTIVYGAGATGWLQAPNLSGTTVPATLTVQPVTGSLAPGSYTATIPVQSGAASNSPQNLTVTFNVAAPPAIQLSSATLNFSATEGGANPASQFITITNGGGGTLSGLGTGTIVYGVGGTGWLQAPNLSGTTAPATLTIQPVTGSLTPGAYSATIPVQSGVASNSPQTLTVNFTVASASAVVAFVGNNQTGLVGYAVNVRPAVRLTAAGNPVSNVGVTFAVQSGGGSIVGNATINTDGNGVAQVGDWVLGAAPGANTLSATVTGTGIAGNPVTFAATGAAATFNITIQNVGPPFTSAVQTAFNDAVAKWQQIIYQDLPDITNFSVPANTCFSGQPAIGPVTVDDILILAKFDTIDGPGKVLGQAGPCAIRNSDHLTILGEMTFDSADVALLNSSGTLNSVILHEMGHVLGFGTLWTQAAFNCLQNPSTPPGTILDTYFSCPKGRAMFDSLGGTSYTGGNKVPVENCGPASPVGCGAGNVNGHWREPVFGPELMTPYIDISVTNPLSRLSAAAMEDLGYTVNYAGADPYTHTFSLVLGGAGGQLGLVDDVSHGPIYVVDQSGRIVQVIRRQ
jgi:hypothetical protein